MTGAEVAAREQLRRVETRLAISEVVGADPNGEGFTPAQLRRHLALYYGADLAASATQAELISWSACAGAIFGGSLFWNARLRKPSRAAMRRVASKWESEIPAAETPLIRRMYQQDNGGEALEVEDIAAPGTLWQKFGKYRQSPEPETINVWRDGGDNRGRQTARRRRFPSYLAHMRSFLDGGNSISSVDRLILEYVVEGKTLQWIADEMGMKKPTVHKRVSQLRAKAGIAGPGAGR